MSGFAKYANFETAAVHIGSEPDSVTGAVVTQISLATTFAQRQLGTPAGADDANSFGYGYEYQRTGNPTRGAFERAMAACERGTFALAFASGCATTACITSILSPGDHVLCVDDVYGGSQRMFRRILAPKMNIEFSFIDMSDSTAVARQVRANTKLVWMETPTNPTLKISDIKAIAAGVHAANANTIVCVDNTFASPYLQNPLSLGADIVMHSVTKYIGGHSDVVMGCAVTNSEAIYDEMRFYQNTMGGVPSPFDCYMALRGLKTLHVRMECAQKNAMAIATFLENTPSYVTQVNYPGLKSHPSHEIAKIQMRGFGAMVTFFIKGGIEESGKFLKSLKLLILAESLGAVESLAECPAVMTHASVPPEERAKLGISDSLIRLSIGIEHIDDLLADVSQALAAAFRK